MFFTYSVLSELFSVYIQYSFDVDYEEWKVKPFKMSGCVKQLSEKKYWSVVKGDNVRLEVIAQITLVMTHFNKLVYNLPELISKICIKLFHTI